ncbi:hypothetical protein FHR32_004873 [Streptosporangium album]|uniref:Uncharacterized protein n=1 Tax=Streptosporangium album TaxID=47479 RepID=A0A7W7S033_9ACTN|nr:hypothetical protein [Streptosporangium album]MBB4940496.1 hypothetical protein [Streptosporangium album]
MSEELRFDHASLNEAGRHLLDTADLFRRHTGNLLAVVHGTGGTAWGGSATGQDMDQLTELLHQACGRLHGNLYLTGEGVQTMAHTMRVNELDIQDTIQAITPASTPRKA